MRFFRNRLIVAGALLMGVGCTSVDNFFGNGMIPPSEQMDTYIDSTMGIRTSLFSLDSIIGNTVGAAYVGSIIDPLTGLTTAEFCTSFISAQQNKSDSLFGENAVMDSMKMRLTFGNYVGDTTISNRITVYQIKQDSVINPQRSYYTSDDLGLYYDRQKPLASFELRGQPTETVSFPREFFDQFYVDRPLTEADKLTNPYFSDSVFVARFRGLVFTTEKVSTGGKMVLFDLKNTVSHMTLYYHNRNPWGADTTSRSFMFYHNEAYYTAGFQAISHDYGMSDRALGGIDQTQIGDTALSVETVYVQSMTGLGARVVLDTMHFSAMRERAVNGGFKYIAVHRAELRWKIREMSAKNYERSNNTIVLYYNYNKQLYVPDYPNIRDNSGGIVNPMGGSLNRSNGYYSQNVTSTIQQLITGKLKNNVVQLFPGADETMAYRRTVLAGSGSEIDAPQLIITYTLLR